MESSDAQRLLQCLRQTGYCSSCQGYRPVGKDCPFLFTKTGRCCGKPEMKIGVRPCFCLKKWHYPAVSG
jgi:hypothetical protein